MSNKPLNISDEAKVQMPMKTVVSLITMVAIGTWAYFGIIETQNKLSTQVELMSKDLTENNWPDYKVQNTYWDVEGDDWVTEDSDKMFYDIEEKK